ncbi:MAG: PBP1A family penicillin-binding protein [Desulfobacteraceae bacterium]|nr:PBP1A family penicillin-binding protein [Desulfobacteraceae bacterium]
MLKYKNWIFLLIAFAGVFSGIAAGAFFSLLHDLPQINSLKQFKPSAVTTVYSNDGKIITRFYTEKRFPATIDKMPDTLINALITTEDRDFFKHSGIDMKSILRAIVTDIMAGEFRQGASTITQQLAKTLFLTPEKSVLRKIKEAILTLQIERRYTKNEILELYLNQVYFGSGAYGVEAASRTYFNKNVSKLTLDEAALIAGLPKAPSIYSPINNPGIAEKRRNTVLHQMLSCEMISKQSYEIARKKEIYVVKSQGKQSIAPYFVEHIKKKLKQQFDLKSIYKNGLNIYTTLNTRLQATANESIQKYMAALEHRMSKNGFAAPKPQAALIAVDIRSGGIISMVGGRSFDHSKFNRATQAQRQPGSAFKPFVYAAALQKGFSQASILLDAPLFYHISKNNSWEVHNFSKKYSGEMTFRKALALSKNTPTARLMEMITPESAIEFAVGAGIRSPLAPNLSLALGTSEVNLLELTCAYIPFANTGIGLEPFSIKKITDIHSKIIFKNIPKKRAVMSRVDAAIITDILKAVIYEGTGTKAAKIKKDIAGKTGTTDQYKDALFIGFSPEIAVGVWVGNDDSTSLGKYETGAKAALPIWVDYITKYLSDKPYQYFDIPDGTKMIYMDPNTGQTLTKGEAKAVKALIKTKDKS